MNRAKLATDITTHTGYQPGTDAHKNVMATIIAQMDVGGFMRGLIGPEHTLTGERVELKARDYR